MVKITVSDKRNPIPQSLELSENIKITTWGAIKVNKADFFPSSFQIKSGEKVIYIDPVEVDGTDKADYIFLTHAHPDHLSLKDIHKIAGPETVVVCSKGVEKKLARHNFQLRKVKPGDMLDLGDLKCKAVEAYNTKPVFLWIKAHPKSSENVGYILTLSDQTVIYHAGDTDYLPTMRDIKNTDVALIPVGGDNLTMNVEEAAAMVNTLKPKMVVPMHYELKVSDDINKFKSLTAGEIQVKVLQ
ncbi:MBL fold metallo-hydrolase [Fulvivirgaceae bacterium BMA12]|uniref:MBL fold metallo-hydrolase n=1 Tax=Agaribacillus aureus TaxID=3051825 RepID=A0ABT8LCG2_9BACT|nr:MBL fold metallo-hydrolase [Fulvivirgaceae bacterium BMA12]